MKNKSITNLSLVIFTILFFSFVSAKEGPATSLNNITKHDKKGRAKVSEVITDYGSCVSEIVYDLDPTPEIHIVLIQSTGMIKVGIFRIENKTESDITGEYLVDLFDEIAKKYCLPMLLPGYEEV